MIDYSKIDENTLFWKICWKNKMTYNILYKEYTRDALKVIIQQSSLKEKTREQNNSRQYLQSNTNYITLLIYAWYGDA